MNQDNAGDQRNADPLSFARAIALRQLDQAPRTRKQLADKMASKNVPEDIAITVLDRLTEVGLIDDLAYAHMLVRSRTATKGLARRALRQELRQKGVSDDFAAIALEAVTDDDELHMATELVAKKLRNMANLDKQVRYRRLAGLLARKGYGSTTIGRVLADLD